MRATEIHFNPTRQSRKRVILAFVVLCPLAYLFLRWRVPEMPPWVFLLFPFQLAFVLLRLPKVPSSRLEIGEDWLSLTPENHWGQEAIAFDSIFAKRSDPFSRMLIYGQGGQQNVLELSRWDFTRKQWREVKKFVESLPVTVIGG